MDFRLIYDSIADEFDKLRSRYCPALFADIIAHAQLASDKTALEIGPGTGQASEPILQTGCSYFAVELGENLAAFMRGKFGSYDNFDLINSDFELHDFGQHQFDLIYSAAAFQWLNAEIAYPKAFHLLKSGGSIALFSIAPQRRNKVLEEKIQQVYTAYFHPEIPYTHKLQAMHDLPRYGFIDIEHRQYAQSYHLTADEFVARNKIMAPQMTVPEPHASKLYAGLHTVVESAGGTIELEDTMHLYLARKP